MITMRAKSWLDVRGVREAVAQASMTRFAKMALMVERAAKVLMKAGGGAKHTPSPVGQPPHVQTDNLRSSIQTARTFFGTYVVGPTTVAWYGHLHEFGGRNHPPRPFMFPALLKVAARFPGEMGNLNLVGTPAGRRLNAKGIGSVL
jgi:HK97 gp10 family phage protein